MTNELLLSKIGELLIDTSDLDDTEEWDLDWGCMIDHLTEIANKLSPEGYWRAMGLSIGWIHAIGLKYISIEDLLHTGSELIESISPNTQEYTLRVYEYAPKSLYVIIAHHDNTDEIALTPISEAMYERNR